MPQSDFHAEPSVDADDETRYAPDETEATRGREQGLGVGARDLQQQRDPQGASYAGEIQNRDEMTPTDAIGENEALDLSVDEDFDDPDQRT